MVLQRKEEKKKEKERKKERKKERALVFLKMNEIKYFFYKLVSLKAESNLLLIEFIYS